MQTFRNHVTLIGNMGQNAQITNFSNGNKVARFSLATSSDSKDKNKSVMSRIKQFFLQMINVIVEAVSTIFANIIG